MFSLQMTPEKKKLKVSLDFVSVNEEQTAKKKNLSE